MSTPGRAKDQESRDGQLRIGRLTKAHGLKGALKVEMYTDDPARRFVPGAVFSLQVPADSSWNGKELYLRELRWYNGHPVAFFDGVETREAAETVVRAILWANVDTVVSDEPEAWFDHELVGLAVLRDGVNVGKIAQVQHLPGQDLLLVKTGRGDVLVPFVSQIVPIVDISGGNVVVTPPAGLFEELVDDEGEVAGEANVETSGLSGQASEV